MTLCYTSHWALHTRACAAAGSLEDRHEGNITTVLAWPGHDALFTGQGPPHHCFPALLQTCLHLQQCFCRPAGSGVVQLLAYGGPAPADGGWLTRLGGGGILSLALHASNRHAPATAQCSEAPCGCAEPGRRRAAQPGVGCARQSCALSHCALREWRGLQPRTRAPAGSIHGWQRGDAGRALRRGAAGRACAHKVLRARALAAGRRGVHQRGARGRPRRLGMRRRCPSMIRCHATWSDQSVSCAIARLLVVDERSHASLPITSLTYLV